MYANITLQIFRIAFTFDVNFCKAEYWQAKHFVMEPKFDFMVIDKDKIRDERFKISFDCGTY